mmetsp:Transcript_148967/g.277717  ORF Transcript_148967/g.277717 Transcript_148967/m.277717 type:complete len:262 (+) Transcript_148967:639-1424(+)
MLIIEEARLGPRLFLFPTRWQRALIWSSFSLSELHRLRFELSTVTDHYLEEWLPRLCASRLHLAEYVDALDDSSKDHVLAVQLRRGLRDKKELRTIPALFEVFVRHGYQAWPIMLELEVLRFKTSVSVLCIDRHTSCAISLGDIPTLYKFARNDTVELALFVMQRLSRHRAYSTFACAQGAKVFYGLWNHITEELYHHLAKLSLVQLYLQEAFGALLLDPLWLTRLAIRTCGTTGPAFAIPDNADSSARLLDNGHLEPRCP